uniref:Uncharacterized protein n=1 Tax=Anguilla anguilla TaxID=7936 RepID=A0A0E9PYA9_ANGAN
MLNKSTVMVTVVQY